MQYLGAINHHGDTSPRKRSIAPHGESIQVFASILEMKRGHRREAIRPQANLSYLQIGQKFLSVKWVA